MCNAHKIFTNKNIYYILTIFSQNKSALNMNGKEIISTKSTKKTNIIIQILKQKIIGNPNKQNGQ